jgi:hypothetical protein
MLNHRDAYDVFANTDMQYAPEVIRRHLYACEGYDRAAYREVRFLIAVLNIYVHYRSDEVRQLIQGLCARFLHDIYQRKKLAGYEDLVLLLALVWRYRHTPGLKAMRNWRRDAEFEAWFRGQWRERQGLEENLHTAPSKKP